MGRNPHPGSYGSGAAARAEKSTRPFGDAGGPDMGVATQHLCRAAPVVASGTVVLTLLTCLVIAKANNVYTGGLTWPFFSDLGRGASTHALQSLLPRFVTRCVLLLSADSPGYYVFCVGLTIVAIALCATWYFNYKFQESVLRIPTLLGFVSPFVRWTATVSTFIGIISTIGLPILVRGNQEIDAPECTTEVWYFVAIAAQAFFSTSSYPTLHNNAAYWFFLLETVAIFLNVRIVPCSSLQLVD
ncbi:unnamed protein product [Phytophthora fragariaefolia]|uniref:Unnamed protein product n=1 Tax=Phytophthora fragariaefolia TaxID=1490495 RepID=A0A9W6U8N7_9STRA|nr:unnamed protein product [Phytophthora fragariaefolia]